MGHNFGLYHAHSLDCGTTVLGSNCTASDYGDTIDTMGSPAAGHFNAFQKERLGWLDYGTSPTITTVQTGGLYTIEPLEAPGSGPKALAILKATSATTGQQTWYYVEYRQTLGFDSFLSTNSNVLTGVVIHTGSMSDGNDSVNRSPPAENNTSYCSSTLRIGPCMRGIAPRNNGCEAGNEAVDGTSSL